MTQIDTHAPGAFSWIELATTDQQAAKAFYGSVFGWAVEDMPMGPPGSGGAGVFYSMFKLDGRNVAAAYTLRQEQAAQGVPPHWMIYVATEDADKTAQKAGELGGQVLAAPFDVFDAGRMAVLKDPGGVVFSVWQARRHHGIALAGVDGTLCWADLNTPNVDAAKAFYGGLFGWKFMTGEHDPSGYLHIMNGQQMIGGAPPAAHRNPHAPPCWLAYIQVSDCDATATKVRSAGGRFHLEPMTMENVGRMAVLADPQGATIAIFQSLRKG